jgi:hypothetical protein
MDREHLLLFHGLTFSASAAAASGSHLPPWLQAEAMPLSLLRQWRDFAKRFEFASPLPKRTEFVLMNGCPLGDQALGSRRQLTR